MQSKMATRLIVMVLIALALICTEHAQSASTRMVEVEPTPEEARFWKWLVDGGADVSNIAWPALNPITGSRGVKAKRMIKGDYEGVNYYVRVPQKLMITEAKALDDPACGKAIASFTTDDKWLTEFTRIALYLVFLRNRTDSFFDPYIQIMPSPSMLADWAQEEMAELQDEQLIAQAQNHLNVWRDELMPKIDPQFFPPELFNWENFHWAMGNVNQRAFSIRDDRNVVLYNAMVPGADLLNHVNIGTHYKMIDSFSAYIIFPVTRDVQEGEECFNGYGLLSNAHLLDNYGFSLKGNVYDEVHLDVLDSDNGGNQHTVILRHASKEVEAGPIIRSFPGASIVEKVDRCIQICQTQLKLFPTTLADDEIRLTQLPFEDSTWRLRFALNHRIGQKHLLTNYLEYCTKLKSNDGLSQMTSRDFDRTAKKLASKPSGWFSLLAAWLPIPKTADDL